MEYKLSYSAEAIDEKLRKIDELPEDVKAACEEAIAEYMTENPLDTKPIKGVDYFTPEEVQEIAEQCGFKDYKYFLKFFKYHQNMSPTEFRNTYYYININNC